MSLFRSAPRWQRAAPDANVASVNFLEAIMRINQFGLAAGLALCAALAACSSGPSRSQAGAARAPGGSGIAAIVTCFRQHGAPSFPAPLYDPSDGRWHFAISPGTVPAATRAACQHLFPSVSPSPPVPQAQLRQLVRLAQCIRGHGVPGWPDPSPDGAFPLPPPLMQKTPQSERALTACRPDIPSGGFSVVPAS